MENGTLESRVQWSPAQRARIEKEWHALRRSFAFHPYVRIVPLAGEPPSEFEVTYTLQTLGVDSAGELAYLSQCVLQIALPANFPHGPPDVRIKPRIFHPNVSDGMLILPGWNPATSSLADAVTRCGQLLAYQIFDPAAVVNQEAMDWVRHYPELIPTDSNAVLSPDTGGEPLERILQAGRPALAKYRERLITTSTAILDGAPVAHSAAASQTGAEISHALGAFFDTDVPQDFRDLATELDAWARSLRFGQPVWDDLRALFAHLRSATIAVEQLTKAKESLRSTLDSLDKLAATGPTADAQETIARLPNITDLDRIVIRLRTGIRDADIAKSNLAADLNAIAKLTISPVGTPGGLLHTWIGEQAVRGVLDAGAMRDSSVEILASIDAIVICARSELSLLEYLVTWAAFTDLVRRGNELAHRLIELGPAGINAYFIRHGEEKSGPYQFEEPVKIGTLLLIARRLAPENIEVFDARTTAPLGKGMVIVKLPTSDPAELRATDDADAMRVQLDYLVDSAREHLARLPRHPKTTGSASWTARFSQTLSNRQAIQTAEAVYQRGSQRWMALYADLTELAQFKQRLGTHYLLERHLGLVPTIHAASAKAKTSLTAAKEKLATIAARSSRDADTQEVLVPPQHAKEYSDALGKRANAEKDLSRIRKLLAGTTAELRERLANNNSLGISGVPKFRLLPVDPATTDALNVVLSDARVQSRIRELEKLLNKKLVESDVLENS